MARTTSPDFIHWEHTAPKSAPVVMASDPGDPPGTGVYGMNVFPYQGQYIGLLQRFHNRPDNVFLDIQLAVSQDGFHFTRVSDRTPFIPCGPIGAWDRFNNSTATNPPIEVGDELRFYYSGRISRHRPYEGPDGGAPGAGIGFASIKRDRFVSLGASFEVGTILTKPLEPQGRTLHLNAESRFGRIIVEALDASGKVLTSSGPIAPNGLDTLVPWTSGGLAPSSGPIQLRFTLENALLFAIWAE